MSRTILLTSLVLLLLVGVVNMAVAADIGAAEVKLLQTIFTGNIGITLGLAIAISGIFTFVQGNNGAGILLIVVGALITILPGVYNGMRLVVCPVAQALGGEC